MAENASIFQTVQIGVEVTPGTNVAADKKLTGLSIMPSIQANVNKFRPMGYKFATIQALGKEWVAANIEGPLTYTEIVYLLSSLMRTETATVNTALSYTWDFDIDSDDADTFDTFSVEYGSSERAFEFSYGIVTGLTITYTRDEIMMAGEMLGQQLSDDITMTGAPTEVDLVPCLPTDTDVKTASTQAGLTAAPPLDRVLSVEFSLTERYGPVWPLKSAAASWDASVEIEPKATLKVKMAVDDEGMVQPLADLRSGDTSFWRIQTIGEEIETSFPYTVQIDFAGKVEEISEFSDEDGVFAVEWTFFAAHDSTWTRALQIDVINELSAL